MTETLRDRARWSARTRRKLSKFLLTPRGVDQWTALVDKTTGLACPEMWTGLPARQRAGKLIDTVMDHLDGPMWVFDAEAAAVLVEAATTPGVEFAVPSWLPPAPTGMITIPKLELIDGDEPMPMEAVSWGPGPAESGEGSYCTIWSRLSDAQLHGRPHPDAILGPITVHGSVMMRFVPIIANELSARGDINAAATVRWRIVAAAWTFLAGDTQLRDIHVDGDIVHGVAVSDRSEAVGAIIERARSWAPDIGPGDPRPVIEVDNSPASGSHDPAFTAGRDSELSEDVRWIPRLHRDTTDHMNRLITSISDRYRGIWSLLEEVGRQATWPQWCYIPVGKVAEVLVKFYRLTNPETAIDHANVIAGVAAWRTGGRHAIRLDNSTRHVFSEPGAADAACPVDLADNLPVRAVVFAQYVTRGDYLAYLNQSAHGPEIAYFGIPHSDGDLDAAAKYYDALLLTPGSIDDAFRRAAAVTGHDDAEGMSEAIEFHTPIIRVMGGLADPDTVLVEAAHAVGRRSESRWPSPDATPADELTLWLSGDKSFRRA